MWVFTTRGFFSAVEDTNSYKPGRVLVRGRVKKDMDNLRALAHDLGFDTHLEETPDRDYRYRVRMKKSVWAKLMARMAEEIDYPNFKKTVTDERRHEAYMQVWLAMLGLQLPARRPVPRGMSRRRMALFGRD